MANRYCVCIFVCTFVCVFVLQYIQLFDSYYGVILQQILDICWPGHQASMQFYWQHMCWYLCVYVYPQMIQYCNGLHKLNVSVVSRLELSLRSDLCQNMLTWQQCFSTFWNKHWLTPRIPPCWAESLHSFVESRVSTHVFYAYLCVYVLTYIHLFHSYLGVVP